MRVARGGLAANNQRVGYLVAFDVANTDQTQVTAAQEAQREPRGRYRAACPREIRCSVPGLSVALSTRQHCRQGHESCEKDAAARLTERCRARQRARGIAAGGGTLRWAGGFAQILAVNPASELLFEASLVLAPTAGTNRFAAQVAYPVANH